MAPGVDLPVLRVGPAGHQPELQELRWGQELGADMKIDRRHFLKMLSAFGGALAAEGFAPAGVLTPEKIALPDKPTVVGPMPRMGGGLSGFVEIVLNHASITLENPMVRDFSVEIPVTWVGG
ncbi:MAG: hypothetical protein GWN58_52575, partial [Anaerolineae bacterium]|nr:hypothetical protein [Anaerolineae bacterium]